MLVPGFTVQELPVKLSNQNNLRFAPDGSLTTLGYDGKVWRLRDTDGDGLEDRAEPFWDRDTLTVPLGMCWSTDGLYVSSSGKVSLLRDTDGDGKADTEEVVTRDWPNKDVASGNVDATAVTLDAAGNVYFGLLVQDYANAYRLRQRKDLQPAEVEWLKQHGRWREPSGPNSAGDEFSLYDLNSRRGTIQKFDPRTKKLETVATGLRVPVALAFNGAGDLFNTDQEGETWMPNGNPLDELNHIISGRNYGFPPRHDKWLPDLVSEPPVVGFGPQHQSACGLVFNETKVAADVRRRTAQKSVPPPDVVGYEVPLPASPSQGLFGPKWWEGDAFVAGESRGKIWRVRLVKTPHGYVGKSYTIARLSMLTLDLAISPKGDLYVCCHSGPPDWGTGPQGEGKVFKISYTDPKAPQPVAVWPASPTEVRVAFDRPLDPGVTNLFGSAEHRSAGSTTNSPSNARRSEATIEFGGYVTAGDRFETLKPPYAVVEQQDATPRGKLSVQGAQLSEDRQELVLTTSEHSLTAAYSLRLNLPGKTGQQVIEAEYDLTGVRAIVLGRSFKGALTKTLRDVGLEKPASRLGAKPADFLQREVESWMPVPDAELAAKLVFPWQGPQRVLDAMRSPNRSGLRVDLHPTPRLTNLVVSADVEFFIQLPAKKSIFATRMADGRFAVETSLTANDIEARVRYQGNEQPGFSFATRSPPDGHLRPISPSDSYSSRPASSASAGTDSRPAQKPDGDWENGHDLFVNKLQCAKCHRIHGEGGTAGPDLANVIHRDVMSLLRDIREPGATLHPEYVTYQAELKSGDTLLGFLRPAAQPEQVVIADVDGKETVVARADLANLHPTGQSLMPTGLLDSLNEMQVRDLLTYLLWEPPVRSRVEAERVIGAPVSDPARAATNPDAPDRRSALRIVLVASKKDHGPGQHDYPRWQEKWLRLLAQASTNATVEKAWEWPTLEQFTSANVLVFYYWNHDWSDARYAQLDAFQQRGGGVVILHSACIADRDAEKLAERIGLSAQPDKVGYRHMPFDLKFVAKDHPLTRGLPESLHFLDEPYWPLIGDPSRVKVLATARVDGADRPLVWTFEKGKGRVFGSILGHYFWTLDDPLYRLLVLRAIAWAGGADLERLTDAALIEAAVK
jgi:putative heme-binding domain-containing protein